jgi:hypothetical protein
LSSHAPQLQRYLLLLHIAATSLTSTTPQCASATLLQSDCVTAQALQLLNELN